METTTIILTSMLHPKRHSLVDLMEMAMGLTEMEMDPMEMDLMDCAARSHAKCANQS